MRPDLANAENSAPITRRQDRFLWERWVPKKRDTGTRVEDESIADFVSRRMGKEMLDRIVAPLTAGIYTADINRLSMLATMGPIAKMETDFGSLAKATSVRRKSGQDSVERNRCRCSLQSIQSIPRWNDSTDRSIGS